MCNIYILCQNKIPYSLFLYSYPRFSRNSEAKFSEFLGNVSYLLVVVNGSKHKTVWTVTLHKNVNSFRTSKYYDIYYISAYNY